MQGGFLNTGPPGKPPRAHVFVLFGLFPCLRENTIQQLPEKISRSKGLTAQISREGNGTPLQYSHLENPMDGGAW